MKSLKDYIKENNQQSVNTYVNEGFWDGLKNFWNWLTGNTDKNDYFSSNSISNWFCSFSKRC